MADDHDDDDFGQKLPPLHIYLKRVLDKYPEGGQILKELVQNADDAGARRVVIMYDKGHHGTDTMWSQSLKDFNGPSLYVYNDAVFQPQDWTNIQHPEQSGKMDDPTKVGRFGLGFISVYHLTDIPSIISGTQIGFLDPHEKYFAYDPHKREHHKGKRGKKWRISAEILNKFPDQFNPYLEPLFDCSPASFENGTFNGTIFRFPLRNPSMNSHVSSAVYDDARVESLFQSYKADAEISLLFLKNIESVALYEKVNANEKPKLLFSVGVTEDCCAKLCLERQRFLQRVTNSGDSTSLYRMDIQKQLRDQQNAISTCSNTYVTVNTVKKQHISNELQNLTEDEDLKLLPWVGVSMRVNENDTESSKGRVFCFLPLPESEHTGLPIHVHGYFGLGDNRRSIKWPDRESEHDKAARWNQLLVHEAFPDAYKNVILSAISSDVSADAVYKAWPSMLDLRGEWKVGVKNFLEKIKNDPILHTNINGGSWQKPSDVLLDPDKDELIHILLERKGLPVAKVPDHVGTALQMSGIETKVVRPAFIRNAIRGDPLEWMNREQKLHLLKYILGDQRYDDLHNIHLLPLADETFTTFVANSTSVYICIDDIPIDLFPNIPRRFASKDMPSALANAEAFTQLKRLTPQMVPSLLKEALPRDWTQGNGVINWTPGAYQHPPEAWLEAVWVWLSRNNTTVSLTMLNSMPLIQLDNSGSTRRLARLNGNQLIYRQKSSYSQTHTLPETLSTYLDSLGIVVIQNNLPIFISQHPQIDTIIRSPTADGVAALLDHLWASQRNSIVQNVANGSNSLKTDIKNLFKNAAISSQSKLWLSQMPLFQTTDSLYMSVSQLKMVVPRDFHGIPISRLKARFLLEQHDSDSLALKLGARKLSEQDLLCNYIIADIENCFYEIHEKNTIMKWVLERSTYDRYVKNLHFVPTDGGLCRPSELFAPDEPQLKLLFKGQPLFPTGDFAVGEPLHCLKRVGLRGLSSVTSKEILEIAQRVSTLPDIEVAEALLSYVTENAHLLSEYVTYNRINKQLGKFLRDLPWVPCESSPPADYPESLQWYGASGQLYRPDQVALHNDAALLLGSVKPLVKLHREVRHEFKTFFDWDYISPDKYTAVEDAYRHLKNAAESYRIGQNVQRMTNTVDAIYRFLNQTPSRFMDAIFGDGACELVWHGNEFTSPNKIAFNSGGISVNLAPYLFILPSAFHQYRSVFEAMGVQQQFNTDVLNDVLNNIKEKNDANDSRTISECRTDLKLVCDILNSIIAFAAPGTEFANILVPCRGQASTLKLVKTQECLFVDDDKESLMEEYHRGACDLPIVHEMIPNETAKRLGLKRLSHYVAPVDNVGMGYDVEGPHQSTVNAIKRNLEMYKEGLDIFKELIQNADDAGATEVKFLIDWRNNWRSRTSLLSDGMEMCHGPALWAYNNATFSESDVTNICSIAGATKKEQLDKIGRFGLGFTSVYHITDVPSLVSGPFVMIFDPRTNHLGNRINPGRPGIKLDIRNEHHRATLRTYPNQFQPFQGIFDCDVSPSSNGFEKTLFRLPLRTEKEADDFSEDYLSKAVYNSQEELTKMVTALKESAPSLLLFTQNVTRVSVYSLSGDSTSTSDYKPLLDITAETIKTLPRCIDSQNDASQERQILKATQKWMQDKSLPVPESTAVVKVTNTFMTTKKSGNEVSKSKEYQFVVSSCMASGRAIEMARGREGQMKCVLPCGGVAVQLGSGSNGLTPTPFDDNTSAGAFSYLPLDVYTGLPFHINGNFLLQPNRRHLWSKSSSAKGKEGGEFEARWNICFMEEVICKALTNLLVDLQSLQADDYLDARDFQSLWPKLSLTESDFHPLVDAFYKILESGDQNLIYNGNRWVSIHDCFFLEREISSHPIGDDVKAILNQKLHPQKWVKLDDEVLRSMESIGVIASLEENTYDLGRFLRDVMFPMITSGYEVPKEQRKAIMLHLLDLRIGTEKRTDFDSELKTLDCFPASPDGEELVSPDQLVHPEKSIGQLFNEIDGRFPHGEEYRREERLLSLAELGMETKNLPWEDICERAGSFEPDESRQIHVERCVILLDLIDNHLREGSKATTHQKERLQNARFLPVLAKPSTYPLEWYESESSSFMSATELLEKKHKYLVGSTKPLLDEDCLGKDALSYRVKQFLGIGNQEPVIEDVTNQLSKVVTQVKPLQADSICRAIYKYLNDAMTGNSDIDGCIPSSELLRCMEELKSLPFVLVDGKYLKCNQLAFEYKRRGGHYLHAVPYTLMIYKPLLKVCGVKESFTISDYIKVIEALKEQHGDNPLPDADASVAVEMVRAIVSLAESNGIYDKDRALALDTNNILRSLSELTYNDMSSMDSDINDGQEINYTHKGLTEHEAKVLEIRTLRQIQLSMCSSGHGFESEFGQREELTTRLKGILREYSSKADVLKELLQNADDAGATDIHIIYDPQERQSTKIVGDSWEQMHSSPSLCVFNNKPFTEADLLGIQKVGVGGKTSDAATTGRFGIGFNAVYHLTDCPTFVTDKEKLCIFDPHVKYAPGATPQSPGRLYQLQGAEGCLATFPDMIDGYLDSYFDLEGGTMFRFPLRRDHNISDISDNCYTKESVIELFHEFEQVAKESLLFLNSIQKISISEIDSRTKKLEPIYSITASVSDEAIRCRNELKVLSRQYQTSGDDVTAIPQQMWVYKMEVEDSLHRSETWLISQVFGVDEYNAEADGAIRFKAKSNLPRGGVAALLKAKQAIADDDPYTRKYTAFTFLPLQVEINLPVHVNGTFELDQSRRNLVKGADYVTNKGGGDELIHNWNKLLAVHVIGPAYAKLIHEAGRILLDPSCESFRKDIRRQLMQYNRLFPTFGDNSIRGEWKLVAKSALLNIGNNLLEVLPVVNKTNPDSIIVTWHHPVTDTSKAFFDNLSVQLPSKETDTSLKDSSRCPLLQSFLRRIGFFLLSSSPSICTAFQAVGVQANFISPESVLIHLSDVNCIAGSIPCPIGDSQFKTEISLRVVLEYCLQGVKKPNDLNGIPLRLSCDGILDIFSATRAVYVTWHSEVLSNRPHLFIHPLLVHSLNIWMCQGDLSQQCFTSGIFKEFTLQELAQHLHAQLPEKWRGSDGHVKWTPEENGHPSKLWMRQMWEFIIERWSKAGDKELDALDEWAILPTANGMVVPPKLSKTVLYIDTFADSYTRRALVSVLDKLGCPHILIARMTESETRRPKFKELLEAKLASPTNPSSVIKVIKYMTDQDGALQSKLTEKECNTLLLYFQEACEHRNSLSEDDIQTLKQMPIFSTVNNNQQESIHAFEYCHFVTDCNLPTNGTDPILISAGCLLLKHEPRLESLYKELGITPINTAGIFLKYILPNFDQLDEANKIAFVEHIRDKVITTASEEEKSAIYSKLKGIAFIVGQDKVARTASCYYDPTNDVFSCMVDSVRLLPKRFNTQIWRQLLYFIGLNHEVNQGMFMKFARRIESDATLVNCKEDYDRLMKQSKALVRQIEINRLLWDSSFLRSIADITFIPSEFIDEELMEIHPPLGSAQHKNGMTPFISYQGAVSNTYKQLTWSIATILPSWAIPNLRYTTIKDHSCLGIQSNPILHKIIQHVQNVCQHMAQRNAVSKIDEVSPQLRKRLNSVIKKMLRHLKNNFGGHLEDIKQCLSNIPICPVANGTVLTRASQLVNHINHTDAERLWPHIFEAPRDLGEFDGLLRALGTTDNLTFDQAAGVLNKVKRSCGEEKMHAEERKVSLTATKCMFEILEATEGKCEITVKELFLPTPEDRLKRSTDLHYADSSKMNHMKLASTKLDFVVPLKQCGLTIQYDESYIEFLPTKLRPQNIQSLLQEKPCETNTPCPAEDNCLFLSHVKRLITSEEMQRVLLRLVQYRNGNKEPSDSQKEHVSKLLTFDNFRCVLELKTGFFDANNDLKIEKKGTRTVFLVTVNREKWQYLLVLTHRDHSIKKKEHSGFYRHLAEKINYMCRLQLEDKHLSYLREVVECDSVDDMNETLTKVSDGNVPEYDDDEEAEEVRPDPAKPGSPVPEDIHHFLDDDPYNLFHAEEIAVYKCPVDESPGQDGSIGTAICGDSADTAQSKRQDHEVEFSYVYVKIIEEVPSADSTEDNPLRRRFKIDIGQAKPIEVSVLLLFKFRRPRKPTDTTIAIFTGDPDSAPPEPVVPPPADIEEAKNRIRKEVREALSLPEPEQKEAIRRLYKKWHPDKNPPEKSELYNEAFKFLNAELERRQKGGSSEDDKARCERWESDIRRDREQERRWQDEFQRRSHTRQGRNRRQNRHYPYSSTSSSSSSYVPPSFTRETPDLRSARLWYRQAEEELKKAQQIVHDLNAPWLTAFALHQVIEKALKAVQFYQNGKPDLNSTDLLTLAKTISAQHARRVDLITLVGQIVQLRVDFTKPRYPDSASHSTSMQSYGSFDEQTALKLCKQIMEIIRDMIGIRQ